MSTDRIDPSGPRAPSVPPPSDDGVSLFAHGPQSDLVPAAIGVETTWAASMSPCGPAPLGDKMLGGYELLEPLGGGSLTRVFRAREPSSGELRAIKLLRTQWAEHPTAVSLIQREARAGMAVRHPSLVALLDAHVTAPPYFVVMELLRGESAAARLRRRPFDLPSALWLARHIAQALGALDAQGFIHGDIKPANLYVTREGHAKLIDLGFAHRISESSSAAERGYVVGTVNYMAPEVSSLAGPADIRSDLYSFGVSLYEMLTGELPYPRGDVRETIERQRLELPRDPRLLVPTLPDGVCSLLDQLLSKNPLRRLQTPAELVARLVALETETLAQRRSA